MLRTISLLVALTLALALHADAQLLITGAGSTGKPTSHVGSALLLEAGGANVLLLENGTDNLCLEGGAPC
jgi:hypothetical protein